MSKWIILSTLFSTFFSVLIPSAQAVESNLKISGKVVAAACMVETQLMSGLQVDLGNIDNTKMQFPGNAADWQHFNLNLINCPAGTTSSTVTLSGQPEIDNTRLFSNTEPEITAAKFVSVQIADANNFDNILSNTDTMTVDIDNDNKAVFPLVARLYTSTGGVRAGKVSSTVTVNFTYR